MRRATILAASLAALGAAGCGDSDDDGGGQPLSASAFRAKANEICRAAAAANENALKGIDRDDTSAIAAATAEAGKRTDRALEDLDDLEGPDAAESGVDRFLDLAEEYADTARRQSDALAKGDSAAASAAEADATRINAEAQAAAQAAGLADCAS